MVKCDERFTTRHRQIMNNKTIRSSISLPEEDHAVLQRMADANEVSLSWMVRKAVKHFLDDADQMRLFNSRKAKKRSTR